MTDSLPFKQLSNATQPIQLHNVTLRSIQPGDDGTSTMTVEYLGTQAVLQGRYWRDALRSSVGQVGYVVSDTLNDDNSLFIFFTPYADQSLRRVYELDVTNRDQDRPIRLGAFYMPHRAHRVCGWRCDAQPDGFLAPAGLVPGPEGCFVDDETEVVTVRIPPEFAREAQRVQLTPTSLLESFIGDLSGICNFAVKPRADGFGSNGSDEREMADAWLERAHGMNAIDLDELEEQQEESLILEDQHAEWGDLLDQYTDRGGDAEVLFQAIDKLINKMDESSAGALLERLKGIADEL